MIAALSHIGWAGATVVCVCAVCVAVVMWKLLD